MRKISPGRVISIEPMWLTRFAHEAYQEDELFVGFFLFSFWRSLFWIWTLFEFMSEISEFLKQFWSLWRIPLNLLNQLF